ncbi:hypothetical protein Bca101_088803 [Brassica carinata]
MCDTNNQLLVSHTVHHLVVGCKEVCQSVDASTLELIFKSGNTVLSNEPLGDSAPEIR